jgi:hypothetical protein
LGLDTILRSQITKVIGDTTSNHQPEGSITQCLVSP